MHLLLQLVLALPLSLASGQEKPAMQEEVNVLVYGTLQLGQALSDTYSSTDRKLQRIVGKQEQQERGIGRLREELAAAVRERRRQLEEVERLKREDHRSRALAHRMEGDLREVQRGYMDLTKRLQDVVNRVQVHERIIPDLKGRVKQHHLMLQVLMEEATRQKKLMTKQKEQLRHITKRASAIGLR